MAKIGSQLSTVEMLIEHISITLMENEHGEVMLKDLPRVETQFVVDTETYLVRMRNWCNGEGKPCLAKPQDNFSLAHYKVTPKLETPVLEKDKLAYPNFFKVWKLRLEHR